MVIASCTVVRLRLDRRLQFPFGFVVLLLLVAEDCEPRECSAMRGIARQCLGVLCLCDGLVPVMTCNFSQAVVRLGLTWIFRDRLLELATRFVASSQGL